MTWRSAAMVACGVIVAVVAGCNFDVPLGNPETSKVDEKLVGLWQANTEDGESLVQVAAYDARTYLVRMRDFDKKEGGKAGRVMCFKAWLTDVKSQRFLTIQNVFAEPKDKPYSFLNVELKDDQVTVRLVDDKLAALTNAKSAEEMGKAIADNLDSPELYTTGKPVYKRLKGEAAQAAVGRLDK